ncbi:MAG: armadillo-type protein [Olpidium bornovanus]|uniref:Armadillo-type protein n=1 Tax=Olpidium bornovanus TaxID=278681 RepID=A0A8H8DM91_9FUNG|nr:MAG: armadillo-type protein [Olpidium bornovanus]
MSVSSSAATTASTAQSSSSLSVPVSAPTSANAQKPVLHGVRPFGQSDVTSAFRVLSAFRDELVKVLQEAKPGDFDEIAAKLDTAGNKLDYRRYVDTFFEILLTGYALAPGGTFLDDEAEPSPFSIFSAGDTPESIRAHVEVFHKLIRRYKYLQRGLEDTIKNVLQYINKWDADKRSKLATALGVFMSTGLVSISVLTVLFKEHLVKEGLSLQFVTAVFRSYLDEAKIDQLSAALKKAGMDTRLLEFFPVNKRDSECFARHFETEDMKSLVDYQNKKAKSQIKDTIVDGLKAILTDEANPKPIPETITYLKGQMHDTGLSEAEFVCLVWDGLMASVDWSTRQEMLESQASKATNTYADMLNAFSTNPKSELALLQKIQLTCYEDAKLMKSFLTIVKNLYKHDVLSDSAIIYWYEKGSKSNGKAVFMKQTEAFVNWLKEQEDDEDEEDENED